MKNGNKIKVLSLSCYVFGFKTYQDALEKTFGEHIPEVEFRSLHLPDYKKEDFLGRIVNWTLTKQVTGSIPGSNKVDHGFNHFRTTLASSFLTRRCLERYLRTYQPDVIHITTQEIAYLVIPLLRQFPSVITIDLTTALVAAEHSDSVHFTHRPNIALERKCFQSATHLITFSDWARRSVINDYGVSPQQVTTIQNSIPLELFTSLIRPKSPTSDKPRLLFVGNDFIRKGGEDLLAVFLEYLSDTCKLDIVTNASVDIPKLPNLRIHRGVRPFSPELLHLYQIADIFVMPSHEDTSPWVFVEAMAAGLPCIGTAIRGIPEIVQSGLNGFTITPRNRQTLYQVLRKLIDDSNLRLSMGLVSRELARKKFDAISNCKLMSDIFYTSIDKKLT